MGWQLEQPALLAMPLGDSSGPRAPRTWAEPGVPLGTARAAACQPPQRPTPGPGRSRTWGWEQGSPKLELETARAHPTARGVGVQAEGAPRTELRAPHALAHLASAGTWDTEPALPAHSHHLWNSCQPLTGTRTQGRFQLLLESPSCCAQGQVLTSSLGAWTWWTAPGEGLHSDTLREGDSQDGRVGRKTFLNELLGLTDTATQAGAGGRSLIAAAQPTAHQSSFIPIPPSLPFLQHLLIFPIPPCNTLNCSQLPPPRTPFGYWQIKFFIKPW